MKFLGPHSEALISINELGWAGGTALNVADFTKIL